MTFLTRFAPSPTGPLHLGHLLSALTVWDAARRERGTVLLRIEDIDRTRSRPEFEAGIMDDLRWLGLSWPEPVWRQSERMDVYRGRLDELRRRNLVYPCFCTRRQVRAASMSEGFEGALYAGTCRSLDPAEAARRIAGGEGAAWRLKLDQALREAGDVAWIDTLAGSQTWDGAGWDDVVIGRKDSGVSYHLAVVIDDAAQAVTEVIRGRDLFHATHVHVLLQRLFDLPTPRYRHHDLLLDTDGHKLSKTRGSEGARARFGDDGIRDARDALVAAGAASSLFDHLGL